MKYYKIIILIFLFSFSIISCSDKRTSAKNESDNFSLTEIEEGYFLSNIAEGDFLSDNDKWRCLVYLNIPKSYYWMSIVEEDGSLFEAYGDTIIDFDEDKSIFILEGPVDQKYEFNLDKFDGYLEYGVIFKGFKPYTKEQLLKKGISPFF